MTKYGFARFTTFPTGEVILIRITTIERVRAVLDTGGSVVTVTDASYAVQEDIDTILELLNPVATVHS